MYDTVSKTWDEVPPSGWNLFKHLQEFSNLILLSSPFTKSSSLSITFFFSQTYPQPTGFASSTCRFWWAPCCRSSTLLPAVFLSSPPSWSAQDASPWGIGKGNGVLCVFLGTQNRTKTKLRLTLTVLMLSGELFWGCLSKAIPQKSVVPLEVGFFLLWQGGW